jgi:hypothetical protein
MTTKDLNILDDLLTRTNDLPDILHLRAAKSEYEFSDDDKKLLTDTYERLDDILKEVAAFINIKFPGRQDHIKAWNDIDFDTKIGDFKVITNNREHIKREWKKGLFDLKSLIKCLKNEVVLLLDNEQQKEPLDNIKKTNNFTGNIIYNESQVSGGQIQSSSFNSSSNEATKKQKQDKASVAKIINWILLIVGGIAALATIYQVYKQFYPK